MEFGSGVFHSIDRYQFQNAKWPDCEGKLHFGLPQWSVKEWRSQIYPSDAKDSEFLSLYSELFSCVEVSSSFYASVPPERFESWGKQVGENFRFLPKWPKALTHDRLLQNGELIQTSFLESLEALGPKLGASLVQLPPVFSREYARQLYYFLLSLPSFLPLCLEFRHPSWFEKGRLYSKLEAYLEAHHIGMALSDTPTGSNVFHLSFPSSPVLIRYLSDENLETDKTRLNLWRDFLTNHNNKLGDVFFVLHRSENIRVPELIEFISPELSAEIIQRNQKSQRELF